MIDALPAQHTFATRLEEVKTESIGLLLDRHVECSMDCSLGCSQCLAWLLPASTSSRGSSSADTCSRTDLCWRDTYRARGATIKRHYRLSSLCANTSGCPIIVLLSTSPTFFDFRDVLSPATMGERNDRESRLLCFALHIFFFFYMIFGGIFLRFVCCGAEMMVEGEDSSVIPFFKRSSEL